LKNTTATKFGLYLRRKLEESPIYENDVETPARDNIGFFTIIRYYFKDILVCFYHVLVFLHHFHRLEILQVYDVNKVQINQGINLR
jgi:hypothetical protein